MMKKLCLKILIFAVCLIFVSNKGFCADIDLSKSFVSDKANIIEAQLLAQLHEVLKNLHKETNTDVVVITLNSIQNTENFLSIENQVKREYLLGGKNQDKWVMVILIKKPYQMNIRVGKSLKKVIKPSTIRAMEFEFFLSKINNSVNTRFKTYNMGRDLYNTTMFLAELIADNYNTKLHIDQPRDEILSDLYYLLGGQNANYFPKTDPIEKFIRKNNLYIVILILIIGLIPLIFYRKRK